MKQSVKSAKVAQSTKVKNSNKVAEKRQVQEQATEKQTEQGFNFDTLNGKYHKDIIQIVLDNIGNINNIIEHNYTKENFTENFRDIRESGIYKIDDKDIIIAVVKKVMEYGINEERTRPKRLYITLKGAKKVTYSDSKTSFADRIKTLFK